MQKNSINMTRHMLCVGVQELGMDVINYGEAERAEDEKKELLVRPPAERKASIKKTGSKVNPVHISSAG